MFSYVSKLKVDSPMYNYTFCVSMNIVRALRDNTQYFALLLEYTDAEEQFFKEVFVPVHATPNPDDQCGLGSWIHFWPELYAALSQAPRCKNVTATQQ